MMAPKTPETSVLVSLAELAEVEEDRIRDEEKLSALARAERARERRLAEQQRREEAAAQAAAEAQERARRELEAKKAQARTQAREQAAVEVARIEAEAKARLAADNAMRAHELAAIRERGERGGRRLQRVLAAVLGLVLCGGSAVVYGFTRHVAGLEQQSQQLRDDQRTLAQAHESAMRAELAALERRYAGLSRRPAAAAAEEARVAVEAARQASDVDPLDEHKLGAFRDALDAWQARTVTHERLAQLEKRQADLAAWANQQRRTELVAVSQRAAARTHAAGADEATLGAYQLALDELRKALAANGSSSRPWRPGSKLPQPDRHICTDPHDPMCGLDGKSL